MTAPAVVRFDSAEFIGLVQPYLQVISDDIIISALKKGVKRACRTQGIFRVTFAQSTNDARQFSGIHDGWLCGKLVGFCEAEPPNREIIVDTGEPLKHEQDNPNRTTITSEYFGPSGGGSGLAAQAIVALTPKNTLDGLPELVFEQYTDLFQAAAMLDLREFLSKENTYNRDWQAEYIRESNGAQERFAPRPGESARMHSLLRPPGGGVREGGYGFGGYWGSR